MFKIYTKAPENTWFEWQFSGYIEMGGEQPNEHFWVPTSRDGKVPFITTPLEDKYTITKLTNKNKTDNRGHVVILNSYYGVQLKENAEEYFEIELEIVSLLDSPNEFNVMIRCPTNKQMIVEKCIQKDFKFFGGWPNMDWPTTYREFILKKTEDGKEIYGNFCFDKN